ncbi:hypothetical protein CASFOL_027530 [Castilleja foliolosa]|uniref:ATPase family AAA domain-containing protein n=1 Tax=Castilleja foliolosa TaxID=1961234 RepID=A0ABD3CG16_9LAMI
MLTERTLAKWIQAQRPAVAPQVSPANPPPAQPSEPQAQTRNDNPRTTSAGFDPVALERGAKALKEITNSSYAKKVFEIMKKQEETRQLELASKAAEYKALRARAET